MFVFVDGAKKTKEKLEQNLDDQLEYGTLGKAVVGEKSENLFFFTSAHKDLKKGDILLLRTSASIVTAEVVESVYDIHEEKHIDAALLKLYYDDNTPVYLPQNRFKKVKAQEVIITKGQKVHTHCATSGPTEGTIVRTNYRKFIKDDQRAKNVFLLDLPCMAGDSGSEIKTTCKENGCEVSVGILAGRIRQTVCYGIPLKDVREYFGEKIKDSLLDIELLDDHYETCNIIYLITCKDCHKQYVGQSKGSFRTRLSQHNSNVRLKRGTSIARHFNDNNHDWFNSRFEIKEALKDVPDTIRFNREAYWICHIRSCAPAGINSRIGRQFICQDLPTTVLEYVPISSNEIDCVTTDSPDTTSNVSDEDRQHPDSPNIMLDLIDFKLNL